MSHFRMSGHTRLMLSAAVGALTIGSGAAWAQSKPITVAPQTLASALHDFGSQTGRQIFFAPEVAASKSSHGVEGATDEQLALRDILEGTGLTFRRDANAYIIESAGASDPQSGSAAGDGADNGTVQALVVTAQKREENIQDVPIAMSAFTQEDLTRSQVATGADLMTQVPNMTFTKTNFTGYSIQLRGIGTQAISATVDPAVAVAFNNTPFIRNRFFEQEFYDLQRIEVLRGPQGTLYGRNATAGVVNLISAKPKLDTYEAKLSADVGNYNSSRLEGMLNIPLANDVVALRIAGAWTKRDGYDVNSLTGQRIDGRDLWSTRVSLRFAPTDKIDANLIWEHFNENDDRLRSGKQLCNMDVVTNVAGFPTPDFYQTVPDYGQPGGIISMGVQADFSQGCKPASLYSPDSFQKTNPLALPYFLPLGAVALPIARNPDNPNLPIDPYVSRTQSTDLRSIEAVVNPGYRAKTDIVELQFAYDLTDRLKLNSETGWGSDFIFSTQDYNRFASTPRAFAVPDGSYNPTADQYAARGILDANGVFCDPQIGCSDRLVAMDLSTARSRQFSQELRLSSDFEGPFNFSLGANFLRYDTEDKYYVFINTLTMISAYLSNGRSGEGGIWQPGATDNRDCLANGMIGPDYSVPQALLLCTYIDPNPITSLNDLGHNYFLSRNPYKLISYAVFGEAYYNLTENLKLTAGLRWTVDKKEAPLIPSWLLAANSAGYPVVETVRQEWREPTGRLALDWKPDLSFTDQTLVYGSYSHGYKAGGMNPPPYGKTLTLANLQEFGGQLTSKSALHPKTFEPEFVNAFELGTKNTLLDGALTLNLDGFYYDYKGYQLSQIVDRSAVTNNYDATVWGLELESDWRPVENLRFGLKLGYERTKVANGMQAIDVMDRTAGQPGWVLERPFPTVPSNCVLPTWLLVGNPVAEFDTVNKHYDLINVGGKSGGGASGCEVAYVLGLDPATEAPYRLNPYSTPGPAAFGAYNPGRVNVDYAAWSTNPADYPCLPAGVDPATMTEYPGVDPACLAAMSNNGEGFAKNLAGKELPNAPHITATLTADYTIPLPSDWLVTLHTDLYYQSESWARIFNTPGYDKLKAYNNVNLAAIFTNEDAGWKIMAYVKNVFDKTNITGAFLNSDDSGLTTNVFLNEPRLYGLRVTKDFAGGPWWTGANLDHKGPFPLTVEVGGEIQKTDAPYETLHADWVDNLPASIRLSNVQNRDLDTGDERSLKLTYQPTASPWSVSAGIRYGRTNTSTARDSASSVDMVKSCRVPLSNYMAFLCDPDFSYQGHTFHYWYNVQTSSWSDVEARSAEKHEIVDFAVGRDFGLGSSLNSKVSAGLRYASFRSDTAWAANAQYGWNIPNGWGQGFLGPQYESSVTRRHITMAANREFKGAGPAVAWDASLPLWGEDRSGHLNVDWMIEAGMLRGERKTTIKGQDQMVLHQGDLSPLISITSEYTFITTTLPVKETFPTPIDISRSKRATVPVLDLSLGLSYEVGRVKVGTGYRWERYFDALDVGQDAEKKADRTFDGPYLKIAVGFGG